MAMLGAVVSSAQDVAQTCAPGGGTPVKLGPIEITPRSGTEKLVTQRGSTCLDSLVSFRIRNVSAGDIRVALFMEGLIITDDLQVSLFKNLRNAQSMVVAGVTPAYPGNLTPAAYLDKIKAQMTTLAKDQVVVVQIVSTENGWGQFCKADPDTTFKRTHRPKTFKLSGMLGTVDIRDNIKVHSLSLEAVPLNVQAE
jgi:hypothetical protein